MFSWSRLYERWRRFGFWSRAGFQMSLGCRPVTGFYGILPWKKIEISMRKDAMTGHLTRCSGTDPRNLPTSASAAKSKGFFRCVLKLYSRPPWTRSVTEPIRAQTAGQKLAADNQAIEAQPSSETVQFPGFQNPGCQQSQRNAWNSENKRCSTNL